MKKSILFFFITWLIGVNQVINSCNNSVKSEKNLDSDLNQNELLVTALNSEYNSRSEALNCIINWFAYWRVHFSANAISNIIAKIQKLGGISGSTMVAVSSFMAEFLSSWIIFAAAVAIATFLVISYFLLLLLDTSSTGGWLGILSLVPGVNWGKN